MIIKPLILALVAGGGLLFAWLLGVTRAWHPPRRVPDTWQTRQYIHDHGSGDSFEPAEEREGTRN